MMTKFLFLVNCPFNFLLFLQLRDLVSLACSHYGLIQSPIMASITYGREWNMVIDICFNWLQNISYVYWQAVLCKYGTTLFSLFPVCFKVVSICDYKTNVKRKETKTKPNTSFDLSQMSGQSVYVTDRCNVHFFCLAFLQLLCYFHLVIFLL